MTGGIRQAARSLMDGQGYFLLLLLLSVLCHFVFPIRVILQAPYTFFGIPVIGAALLLAARSRSLFLRNRTTLSPYEVPGFLMTTGPFRFSRNPVYLAMAAMLFGSAIVMGTLVTFLFPILFVAIIEMLFIPGEEQALEKKFGKDYREYRKRVRRWI